MSLDQLYADISDSVRWCHSLLTRNTVINYRGLQTVPVKLQNRHLSVILLFFLATAWILIGSISGCCVLPHTFELNIQLKLEISLQLLKHIPKTSKQFDVVLIQFSNSSFFTILFHHVFLGPDFIKSVLNLSGYAACWFSTVTMQMISSMFWCSMSNYMQYCYVIFFSSSHKSLGSVLVLQSTPMQNLNSICILSPYMATYIHLLLLRLNAKGGFSVIFFFCHKD